ncbi:MAG: lipid-A-disaccharide synthase N-terminal domain-containing protein [Candidatus Methylomirabilia bacterium]
MTWDAWVALGLVAQGVFFTRFLVQWLASERARQSVIPVAFWYLSLVGSLLLLVYSIHARDPVFILGQSTGSVIYIRNIVLINRRRSSKGDAGDSAGLS